MFGRKDKIPDGQVESYLREYHRDANLDMDLDLFVKMGLFARDHNRKSFDRALKSSVETGDYSEFAGVLYSSVAELDEKYENVSLKSTFANVGETMSIYSASIASYALLMSNSQHSLLQQLAAISAPFVGVYFAAKHALRKYHNDVDRRREYFHLRSLSNKEGYSSLSRTAGEVCKQVRNTTPA